MAKKTRPKAKRGLPAPKAASVDHEPAPRLGFPVVGIGGSAGALEAMNEFFRAMPPKNGMAFVVIQHLPPERNSMLGEILGKHTDMPVAEIKDGIQVEPDHVYVIRPGRTVTIRDGRLHLTAPLERPGHQRPVDDFFRSLAVEQHERAICVVLSGMGSNGTAGAQAVKAVGGLCIAQEPESAQYPSMPRALLDAGHADFVLRPSEIPEILLRYCAHPYAKGSDRDLDTVAKREQASLKEILALLRVRLRLDFSGYKKPTLLRRVQRRMGLNHVTVMSDYVRVLRQNPAEIAALADELRIHVTGFFRDPEAWEALRKLVIVPMIAEREDDSSVRAWVTACASGEEAFTLAILLVEAVEASGKRIDIKIFATDTAERTLTHARAGIYPNGIESDVSPGRLERFFDRLDGTYRVKKELRELVVFALQNVLQNPPFSRLDICTCRNLLIYLEPEAQARALDYLHFGLRKNGALLLGSSEAVSGMNDQFETIDKKHRLYRRIGPASKTSFELTALARSQATGAEAIEREDSRALIAQHATRALLDRFCPGAVVVDRQLQIVHFHGQTARYLDQPRGAPTRGLIEMVHESIRGAVRTAMRKAIHDKSPVVTREAHLETPKGRQGIEILVTPLYPGKDSYFVVCFLEQPAMPVVRPAVQLTGKGNDRALNQELNRVRNELRSTIDELQSSNEEMQAANEEATSINEELQSSNEELETSKEELQSLNEELTTVNSQLQAKMEELETTTTDLSSLLSSTNIAVVFLDRQFRIRRYTPSVKDLVDIIPTDVGRPLQDLARKFSDELLFADARAVLDRLTPMEREIITESGSVYVRRVLPYINTENRIDGVVITFVDISGRKRAESSLRDSEERHRLILDGIKEYAIFMLDPDGLIATWTPSSERVLGFSAAEAIGRPLSLVFPPDERDPAQLTHLLERARENSGVTEDGWHVRKDGNRFWGSGMLAALRTGDGSLQGYVKVLRDNTERKATEEALKRAKTEAESANQAKDHFLATISHELRTPLTATLLWAKLLNKQEKPEMAQVREGLDAIEQSAKEQQMLIEELVDTSRIVAGKLRLQISEVSLVPLARTVLEMVRPLAVEKGVTLTDSLDAETGTVSADPLRLQQILSNLLSNAVKFTPSKGRVRLVMKRQGDQVEIQVSDTGQGISPDFLPRMFERFTQADPSSGPKAGLGLGLSISRQLAALHGGDITVHSDGLAKGSTFTVRLPLPRITTTASAGNGASTAPDSLRGLKVLLVEDDPETRSALSLTLTRAGADIATANSAAGALREYERLKPDIILSDIGLGRMSGHELIGKIRQKEAARKTQLVPAVALTAYTDEKNQSQALKSGFQQVLGKPIEPTTLVRVLSSLRDLSIKD